MVAVYLVFIWGRRQSGRRWSWAATALLVIAAVVMTHDITSYATIVFLTGALGRAAAHGREAYSSAPVRVRDARLTVVWLVFIASRTVGYLQPVFTRACTPDRQRDPERGIGSRQAFRARERGRGADVDRATSVISVMLIAVFVPIGVVAVGGATPADRALLVLAGAATM